MKIRALQSISFLAALLLTVTLSSCGSSDGGTETGGGTTPEKPYTPPVETYSPPPVDPVQSPAEVLVNQIEAKPTPTCPDFAPEYEYLPYSNLTGDELLMYEEILYCYDQGTAFVTNRSDGVWVFENPVGFHIVEYGDNSAVFRSIQGLPQMAYMVPGDSASVADMSTITWVPDPKLTAAWAVSELSIDYMRTFGAIYAGEAIQQKTGHGKAMPHCVVAAHGAATSTNELDDTSEFLDKLQASLKGAGAGATCYAAMQNADDEAKTAGHAQTTKTSWTSQVDSLAGQVDTKIQVGRFVNFVTGACAIIPRC